MKKKELERVHILVSGRVQGVFFRAHTQDYANSLGIKGWVRNTRDGRVEIVAEGEKERLEKFILWCRQGPPGSRVDNVETEWEQATGEFKEFRIEYSH
jgi:acylphosphatase